MKKRIGILGSTGSIGTQTLDVLSSHSERFEVVTLSGGSNVALLAEQVERFQPEVVAVATEDKVRELRERLQASGSPVTPDIYVGSDGLNVLATWPAVDALVVGLSGFIGVVPTLSALRAGKHVLTANKETFVVAGHLVSPYLSQVVPLDSEHSAIFQCLQGTGDIPGEVRKLYLTASGGPFREFSQTQLDRVTVEQALQHPNWTMGAKITIDSATMMNKGLEIIEAHHLFQLPLDKIDVVVHPQSIAHSAVAFVDGSLLAQMGQPDMRVPIQYGLTFPQRWPIPFENLHLDLANLAGLTFEPADETRFPCLRLARWAAETGGTLPIVLNAADEVAVQAFLDGAIGFMEIPLQIERVMQAHLPAWETAPSLSTITAVDAWARTMLHSFINREPAHLS